MVGGVARRREAAGIKPGVGRYGGSQLSRGAVLKLLPAGVFTGFSV